MRTYIARTYIRTYAMHMRTYILSVHTYACSLYVHYTATCGIRGPPDPVVIVDSALLLRRYTLLEIQAT
jgi:hypothetical protein